MRRLTKLAMANFRGFSGVHDVPLNASVVLIHGSNGVGKSALLQAIECAFTGDVDEFRRYGSDYPRCFANVQSTGGTELHLSYLDQSDIERTSAVRLSDGKWEFVGQVPDVAVRRFFREQVYLPQTRLARFLGGPDKKSERQSFEESIAELLGLGYLSTFADGLELVGDIRRVKRDCPRVAELYDECAELQRRMPVLRSRLSEVQTEVSRQVEIIRASGEFKGVLERLDLASGAQLRELAAHILSLADTDHRSAELLELRRLLGRIVRARDVLAAASTAAEGDSQTTDVGLAQAQVDQLVSQLGKDLAEVWRRLEGAAVPLAVSLPASLQERYAVVLTSLRQLLARWAAEDAQVSRAQEALDALSLEIAESEAAMAKMPQPSSADALVVTQVQLIEDALTALVGDNCPVCERDFRETGEGSLRVKLEQALVTAKATVQESRAREGARREAAAALARLQARRDSVSAGLPISAPSSQERQDRTRLVSGAVQELELLASKIDALSRAEALASAARQQALVQAESLSQLKDAEQFIASCLSEMVPQSQAPTLTGSAAAEAVYAEVERRCERLERDIRSSEALLSTASRLNVLLEDREKAEQAIETASKKVSVYEAAIRRVEEAVEQGRRVRSTAAFVQANLVQERFSRPLSVLWADVFARITKHELFRPSIGEPEVARGRMRLPIQGVAHGVEPFAFPESVMSCGNTNAAAVSLFLCLHLMHRPRAEVLILDDPVQNMDDLHVLQFAALLRTVAYECGRQLVVAVHERALFEYLSLELGPTRPDETLLTLELERTEDGARAIKANKRNWTEDPVQLRFAQA